MKIEFFKYHGTGNDFILLDARNREISLTTEQIANLCHRRFGIGADGLMLLREHPEYDFAMQYFNSDGKESTMCGNGGRCMIAFAMKLGLTRSDTRFIAADGPHRGRIMTDGLIELEMNEVTFIRRHDDGLSLNTGSPHFVKTVTDLNIQDFESTGRIIRYEKRFGMEGTNVNFVRLLSGNHLAVRTYERGVEAETWSCGTGSVASAIAMHFLGIIHENRVKIETRGGELLVGFHPRESDDKSLHYKNVTLTGSAQFVFNGIIVLDES